MTTLLLTFHPNENLCECGGFGVAWTPEGWEECPHHAGEDPSPPPEPLPPGETWGDDLPF
jgi:hypothetical protein